MGRRFRVTPAGLIWDEADGDPPTGMAGRNELRSRHHSILRVPPFRLPEGRRGRTTQAHDLRTNEGATGRMPGLASV